MGYQEPLPPSETNDFRFFNFLRTIIYAYVYRLAFRSQGPKAKASISKAVVCVADKRYNCKINAKYHVRWIHLVAKNKLQIATIALGKKDLIF